MKKIEQFTNCYQVAKTLRFRAIPTKETQENIEKNQILTDDFQKNKDYGFVKKLIDKRHKELINNVLSSITFEGLKDYFDLYQQKDKTEGDKKNLEEMKIGYEEQIAEAFKRSDIFDTLFSKEMVREVLPQEAETKKEEEALKNLYMFTTIFQNYNNVRKTMYTNTEKHGSIPYRIIEENLPRFMSNIRIFEKVRPKLDDAKIEEIECEILDNDYHIEDFFNMDFYSFVLTQKQIELYNAIIGGISTKDSKIQGLNELVNLHNQKTRKIPGERLPKFKQLNKQILADTETMSFVFSQINNEEELLDAIKELLSEDYGVTRSIHRLDKCVKALPSYNHDKIYIVHDQKTNSLTSLSHAIYNDFNIVKNKWFDEYDLSATEEQRSADDYEDKREKAFKKVERFTLNDMQKYGHEDIDFFDTAIRKFDKLVSNYSGSLNRLTVLIDTIETPAELKAEKNIAIIKNYLDSIKAIQGFLRPFVDGNNEADKDEMFYSELIENTDALRVINAPYNKIRNYLTKKPYSEEKFKLFFGNSTLLGGWDKNKEKANRSILLRDNNNYYLAILNSSKEVKALKPSESGNNYEKYVSRRLGEPSKMLPHVFFSDKGRENYPRSAKIDEIYETKTYTKGSKNFSKENAQALIEFYMDAIPKYPNYSIFDFSFKDASEYEDTGEFFKDVKEQSNFNGFEPVSKDIIENMAKEGRAYLFQIYNKDFSEKSHGTPNLHTLYFLSLFDENNDNKARLAGGGEIFMRRKSLNIEDVAVHKANKPMKNKNVDNPKKTTTLPYDVYKDRRYTKDQYNLHLPIIINALPEKNASQNQRVKDMLMADKNPYVIGIDRDENNLLYAVVTDSNGNIVEQQSLNIIRDDKKEIEAIVNYKTLIANRREERTSDQKSWKQIENIKDLRNGYISQAVHKVCNLIEKYDAVVAMEYLGSEFGSKKREEKDVYKNFQVALCDKLRYMTFKNKDANEIGGVLNGYQLTNDKHLPESMQDGIVFFVPGSQTSQIDTATGFVNMLYPRTRGMKLSSMKEYFGRFDSIRYESDMDMFAFEFDYSNFPKSDAMSKKKWTVYTNGSRVRAVKDVKKNTWSYEDFNLTTHLKHLFNKYSINYKDGELKDVICNVDKLDFYKELVNILRLTVQMRNTTPNGDVNYLVSPVLNSEGKFFDTRGCKDNQPQDASANSAYNIARKVLLGINNLKTAEDTEKATMVVSQKEWLRYAQKEA